MITARLTARTDSSNRSLASNTMSKRSFANESLTTRRAKQLLIANQNSLNNLLSDSFTKSSPNTKSLSTTNSQINENNFIKKPFKHYVKRPSKAKETVVAQVDIQINYYFYF